MTEFKLWLEFEEVDPASWVERNNFANIHVDLLDGRHYGINVWTYEYWESVIQECNEKLHIIPPDLFVKELTRKCIEATIADLLEIGDLETVLNPSVLSTKMKI